jgi:mevalonate kinase
MPGPEPALNSIDTFELLHHNLVAAIEASMDAAATEIMREADDTIQDAITALNQADFHARTVEFKELTRQINTRLTQLKALKAEMERIVADVKLAANVVDGIDSAVSVAAKVFPI